MKYGHRQEEEETEFDGFTVQHHQGRVLGQSSMHSEVPLCRDGPIETGMYPCVSSTRLNALGAVT